MTIGMYACDARPENLPNSGPIEVSGRTDFSQELVKNQRFFVTNQFELENAVNIINDNDDDSINFEIEISAGIYELGVHDTEIRSKHLDDETIQPIKAGLIINTDSNLIIKAADSSNKPQFSVDGVNNDVGILVNGSGDVTIRDIEIHTKPTSINPTDNPINSQNSVRAALYLGGDQISPKVIKIDDVSCFDNVDRSAFKDELNVEYTGIIVKNAQRAEINNIRLERFYSDGISLFNVFTVNANNLHIIRDGARMRSGVVVGLITTGTSYMEINNLHAEGYYKGINVWPSNGLNVDQDTLVLRKAKFINNSGNMYYLTNVTEGNVILDSVENDGIDGVAFPVLASLYANISNSSFTLMKRDPFLLYPQVLGAPSVVRTGTQTINNSSIINHEYLPAEARDILTLQGFSLN